MKHRYLLLLFLVFTAILSNAQIHKKFLDKFNKEIKDSTKANSYILYKKIEQDSDYIWVFAKYNMGNTIMEKGSCLDSELTVKHGKFIYYREILRQHSLGRDSSALDTEFVREAAGYYSNDKMEGTWLSYFINGVIESSNYFEYGVREGLSKSYYDNGALYIQGYYLHGLKEGDWYTYNRDSSVLTRSQYKHNFQYNYDDYSKQIFYNAYPPYLFNLYIYNYLRKLGFPLEKQRMMINFTITTDGKLIDPEIKLGINPSIDKSIIEAIKNCPTWKPAKINKKIVAQRITFLFAYDGSNLN